MSAMKSSPHAYFSKHIWLDKDLYTLLDNDIAKISCFKVCVESLCQRREETVIIGRNSGREESYYIDSLIVDT